jgi:hypothetical protein
LVLEQLEARALLTSFLVTTAGGNGDGSLDHMIRQANAQSGADSIWFDTGIAVVTPTAALTAITEAVTINGEGRVTLSGTSAGVANGLTVLGSGTVIRGMTVSGFASGAAIDLIGASQTRIYGNRLGTNLAGDTAAANLFGVRISSGSIENIIGTDGDGNGDETEGNLIAGNLGHGVLITGAGTNGNVLAGNLIGTNAAGDQSLGNGDWANVVVDYGVSGTRIGTNGDGVSDALERNVISGHLYNGIGINGVGTLVAGNYIGTNKSGTAALPNGNAGVIVGPDGQDNIIGTNGDGSAGDAAEGNLISGNLGQGVTLWGSGNTGNVLAGNLIGTNAAGDQSLGNGDWANVVVFYPASGTRIGTNGDGVSDSLERNVISGHLYNGIGINGVGTLVAGNYIGTNKSGTAALPNGNAGVIVGPDGQDNVIGTNGDGSAGDAAEGNLISGNLGQGVTLWGSGNTRNRVSGNLIGTDVTGTLPLANQLGIGVTSPGNYVGTNGDGVSDGLEGNVISGNSWVGIWLTTNSENEANNNVVAGNRIGTNRDGSAAVPNQYGIYVNAGATGNRIGTNGDGVSDPVEANTISYNDVSGVLLADSNSVGNRIRGNAIYGNSGLGIDLSVIDVEDGVTTNDPLDADTGPNTLQNYPVLDQVSLGGTTHVVGTFSGKANATITLDFYATTVVHLSGHRDAQSYLGSATATTDSEGFTAFDLVLPAVSLGEYVTATATDADGNTSEFAADVIVILDPFPWQNKSNPLDTRNDGNVIPLDVLTIINELHGHIISDAAGRLPTTRPANSTLPYFDVNGDGYVSPIDVLRIINRLNEPAAGEGEADEPSIRAAVQLHQIEILLSGRQNASIILEDVAPSNCNGPNALRKMPIDDRAGQQHAELDWPLQLRKRTKDGGDLIGSGWGVDRLELESTLDEISLHVCNSGTRRD